MDRLLELLAKKKSKSLKPEEQVELSDLLSDENSRVFANTIDDLFQTTSEIQSVRKEDIDSSVKKIIEKIRMSGRERKTGNVKKIFTWGMAVAAVFLLAVLGLNYLKLHENASDKSSRRIVQTKKGSKSMTTLPDGTKVWINSETKITYEKSFGEKTREVDLEGEAYFDVTEDKDRPFIVHTSEMDIRVIGTIFNVRAYADEVNAQTTLIKGSVEVQLRNENNARLVLKPNEKVIVKQNHEDSSITKEKVLTPQLTVVPLRLKGADSGYKEIQWVNNRLAFEDQNLNEIIPVLERWYDVDIELDRKPAHQRLFNGVFESDNIDDVMRTLSLTLGFNYRKNGNKINIY